LIGNHSQTNKLKTANNHFYWCALHLISQFNFKQF